MQIAPAESNQLARALDDEHTAFTILLPVDAAINQLVSAYLSLYCHAHLYTIQDFVV